ncbi:alpha/beta hydrolase [uncultured Friedmanniella sp.]|uniref:alpha/beta hydrolase n=1 Tax=uncultured Friedmanniella sp. TaxID=335381 RepID=UPI0035CAC64C
MDDTRRAVAAEQVLWSVPETERAGRPLLVLLHGHGMDERMGVELYDHLPAELVLASIRGPLRVLSGYGWYPLNASLGLNQIDEAARSVLAWVREQPRHMSVGILGFSQGSSIALQCMRLAPDQFDYGVVLSGFAVPMAVAGDEALAARRPPVFSGRGDSDPLIPLPLVTMTDSWLAQHAEVTQRVYPGLGHNVSAAEIDDLAAFLRDRVASPT